MPPATTGCARRPGARRMIAIGLLSGYGFVILCTFWFVLSRQAQAGICYTA